MKKVFILLCIVISILSVTAMAEAQVEFSLTSANANPGDEIELVLSVNGNTAFNSIALSNFVYDEDSLEFVAFENYDSIKSLAALTPFFDTEKMAIVIGFKKKATHSVDICTLRFKVKDGAASSVTVSATPLAKNSSTALTSSFAPATVTVNREAVSVQGASLVLDGSIGVKTYFAVNTETVDISSVTFSSEIYDTELGEVLETVISTVGNGIFYDEEKSLYYTVAYVAPKDSDNTEIRSVLNYKADGKNASLDIPTVTVPSYIEDFKKLAKENPTSEYGKGIQLVEALDSYTKYADNFFSNDEGLESVTADIEAINATPDPVTSGKITGVELYATSLILEDKTTIRHYFKVSSGVNINSLAFKLGDKSLAPQRKQGTDYIYVDIPNILAHDMDKTFDLVVCDSITVSYSVLNYVKLAVGSSDTKIANLVKALYNYHSEAKAYFEK
ncbi:MAG: hypothetical protein E7613_10255 [Ruminococcaceae bacterium]|nr:hypothetical protein [Oscillospiraceae bacterium]